MLSHPIPDRTECGLFPADDIEVFSRRSVLHEIARRSNPPEELGGCPVLEPGKRIDRFRLSARLGQGATGIVFAAYDERHDRAVALKVLRWTLDPVHRQRFLREGSLGAEVKHQNLVEVFEIVDAAGWLLMVMELVRGRTLRERMTEVAPYGGLSREETLRIARRVCRGLAAVHEARIIHRDVKPGNVMIGHDGAVKLLDLGIAKVCRDCDAPPAGEGKHSSFHVTEKGVILGTPGYMSPEQARGEPLGASADVFSMGVMLYEMLTGARPFSGSSALEVLYASQREQPVPPSLRRPGADHVDPALDHVVLRCLEKNARARHVDASELLRDLHTLSRLVRLARAP